MTRWSIFISREAFDKLSETERDRILDSCVEEFVSKGYANASTNSIVGRLGIAKGSLFYWFGSKDGLYLHLIDRAGRRFVSHFRESVRDWPTEILARLRALVEASLSYLEGDSGNFRLYWAFLDGDATHLRDGYLSSRMSGGLEVWADWFSGVDTSDFRAPLEEVRRLLAWQLAGIKMELLSAADLARKPKSFRSAFLERLDTAIRLLAHAIYRHPAKWGYGKGEQHHED